MKPRAWRAEVAIAASYDDRLRLFVLTAAALLGFAANSLLTRAALGAGRLDPASFTLVRLATGAATLAILVRARSAVRPAQAESAFVYPRRVDGWWPASALAAYAILFTLAYSRVGASVGALVLFGSVQVTMIGAALVGGE